MHHFDAGSPEAKVTRAQTLERGAIGPHDIGIEGVSGGDQPRVVLAQAPRGAALQQGAATCLGEVESLD